MPLHDYRCTNCGYVSEELSQPEHCRECQTPKPERLFPSSPAIPYFKAGGFYLTDYKGRNTPQSPTTTPKDKQ